MTTNTTNTTEIKVAGRGDIPVISILAHAVWPEAYGSILSEAQLKYMLDLFYAPASLEKQFDQKHVFLLAMQNAETVGFASYSHGDRQGAYAIHKLYVHPMIQGKGIGKKLLDRIVSDVLPLGAKTVTLYVNRENPARQFYERYGFEVTGEKDTAIGEGYFMTDYVMTKNLNAE